MFDFKSGSVVYNEYHIDFSRALSKQLDHLTEDLLQVKYDNGYLLDVGWYPEYDFNGTFVVQVVKDENWELPIYYAKCVSEENININIANAVLVAMSHQKTREDKGHGTRARGDG